MKSFFLSCLILSLTACATKPTHQAREVLSSPENLPQSTKLDVPFIKQRDYFCAPASVSMLFKYEGLHVPMDELAPQMMSAKAEGSFPQDVVTAVRRNKMLPIIVKDFRSMLKEVAEGRPVMVFENLGLDSLPTWHYAVVTGYDLKKEKITLHTGHDKNKVEHFYDFEFAWKKANYWAMVTVKPGDLSATGDDLDHALSAAALENLGFKPEAELSYESILAKWPSSLSALIGLGNISYERADYPLAIKYLERATKLHPTSAIAWHNLATAQGESKRSQAAKESAQKALSLVDKSWEGRFKSSLQKWL